MDKNLWYCKDNEFDDNDYVCLDDSINGESVIAFKVYDSCEYKECLDTGKMGPAKAIEKTCVCDKVFKKGDAISPPCEAHEVDVTDLRIEKIHIKKKKSKIKRGFWDIQIRYVFIYEFVFRDKNNQIIGSVKAKSVFHQCVSLFGSNWPRFSVRTDITKSNLNQNDKFKTVPFVMVKAKAIILTPKIYLYDQISSESERSNHPVHITAMFGLFAVVSLFRIVNLIVCSEGFYCSDN